MNTKGNIMSTNQSSAKLRELADLLERRAEYEKVTVMAARSFATFDLRSTPRPAEAAALLMHDIGGEWQHSQQMTNGVPGDTQYRNVYGTRPLGFPDIFIYTPSLTEAVAA